MHKLKLKDMESTFVSIFRNLPGFDGKSLFFVMKLPGSRVGGLAGLYIFIQHGEWSSSNMYCGQLSMCYIGLQKVIATGRQQFEK